MNIDQSELYYISMDLTQQALQTNVKFFFQILKSFFELVTIFKIIVALGLCKRGGGKAFVLNSTHFSFLSAMLCSK